MNRLLKWAEIMTIQQAMYFSKHYRLIAIDRSKQIELANPDLKQQINFIGRLEEDARMLFITEK